MHEFIVKIWFLGSWGLDTELPINKLQYQYNLIPLYFHLETRGTENNDSCRTFTNCTKFCWIKKFNDQEINKHTITCKVPGQAELKMEVDVYFGFGDALN